MDDSEARQQAGNVMMGVGGFLALVNLVFLLMSGLGMVTGMIFILPMIPAIIDDPTYLINLGFSFWGLLIALVQVVVYLACIVGAAVVVMRAMGHSEEDGRARLNFALRLAVGVAGASAVVSLGSCLAFSLCGGLSGGIGGLLQLLVAGGGAFYANGLLNEQA